MQGMKIAVQCSARYEYSSTVQPSERKHQHLNKDGEEDDDEGGGDKHGSSRHQTGAGRRVVEVMVGEVEKVMVVEIEVEVEEADVMNVELTKVEVKELEAEKV